MPQYLLSVIHPTDQDLGAIAEEDMQRMFTQVGAFNEELRSSGAWVFAGGLMPPSDSTTVDATGAEPVVTDGPYAEAKDVIGGFLMVTAKDLNEATELSKGCPVLEGDGMVEVRPIRQI